MQLMIEGGAMTYPIWRDPYRSAWDPFAEIGRVLAALSSVRTERGQRGAGGWPGDRGWFDIDVDDSDDGWTVTARLPGMAPEEVVVEVEGRELSIRARKATGEEGDGQARMSERSAFHYRLSLPSDVDPDKVDATMDHGLLTIRLPRSAGSRRRQITVGQAPVEGQLSAGPASAETGASTGGGTDVGAGTSPGVGPVGTEIATQLGPGQETTPPSGTGG
jgi:HSP20 family protein